MPMSNSMTTLLNKIERRLGTLPLNLPDKISKDKWPNVIKEDTLETYSIYFPHNIIYPLNKHNKNNLYYIIY